MEKIKEHKKDLILFFIVFLVSIVMCGAFLQPHYTHDTYKIIYDGYEFYSYDKFLKEARPFTAIITLIANKINLPIEIYMIISFVLALIFLSISVLMVYKLFIKQFTNNSKLKDIVVLIISFITIFNYLAIEHILYLECSILALGILLSVIAAKVIISNEKYAHVKALIIIIIAVFCYQGSIAIFPMLVLMDKLLFKTNKVKNDFIEVIKIILIYGIAMLLTILFAEFVMGGSRITMNPSSIDISNIITWVKELAINSLGVILPYIHILLISLTIIFIEIFDKSDIKGKNIYVLKYLFVILASIVICMAPIVVGSGLSLTPRMCIAYGTTIGISLFIMMYIADRNNKKYQVILVSSITIIFFILNVTLYIVLTNQHILTNKLDEKDCKNIQKIIEEYEAKTNKEITKMVAVCRPDKNLYYPNIIHAGAITQKALNSWANKQAICFYLQKKYEFVPITLEQYISFWGGKSWNQFSEEQVVIKDDILYFCAY